MHSILLDLGFICLVKKKCNYEVEIKKKIALSSTFLLSLFFPLFLKLMKKKYTYCLKTIFNITLFLKT